MAHRGKNYQDSMKSIDPADRYGLDDAVRLVKMTAKAKFDETIDAAFNLNVNPRHAEEMVRGSAVLPHGRGKSTRVLVFAKGEKAAEAEEAGADAVGAEDVVAKIEDGWSNSTSPWQPPI